MKHIFRCIRTSTLEEANFSRPGTLLLVVAEGTVVAVEIGAVVAVVITMVVAGTPSLVKSKFIRQAFSLPNLWKA